MLVLVWGTDLQEQVSPAVPLEGGQGDVQRVGGGQAVALVNEAAREVEQVARLQDHVQHRLPDLILAEICFYRKNTTIHKYWPRSGEVLVFQNQNCVYCPGVWATHARNRILAFLKYNNI